MKKFVVIVLACLMGLFALTGCGSSQESAPTPEELIRADIITQFQGIFKEDGSVDEERFVEMAKAAENAAKTEEALAPLGLDLDTMMRAYCKKMSLTINGVEVTEEEGNTAITINTPHIVNVQSVLKEELAADPSVQSMTQEELKKHAGKLYLDIFGRDDCPMATADFTLFYKLVDGTWTLQNPDVINSIIGSVSG